MNSQASPSSERVGYLLRVADRLRSRYPELDRDARWRSFVTASSDPGPCLHLEDCSGIRPMLGTHLFACLHDRARMRAHDGEVVASAFVPPPGYETYCRARLGLGDVDWLHPRPGIDARQLAMACWRDADVRSWLVDAFRSERLVGIHPYMGTRHVFELARLLRTATGRPVPVVAPPPALCAWVNDKIVFSETVRRLFGPGCVPRTHDAASLAILAYRLQALADDCGQVVVKIPDAAGGRGNLVLDASSFRGRALGSIRTEMRSRLFDLGWNGSERLLVGRWEERVLTAPSVQTWIPPLREGEPTVDGVFEQRLEGEQQRFVGVIPAVLPPTVAEEMRDRSWSLAAVYQRLGYVGRCSFDFVVTGRSLEDGHVEFIECNGRWGGTSLPMTLMDRVLGSHRAKAWMVDTVVLGSGKTLQFADALDALDEDLLDATHPDSGVVVFNPSVLGETGNLPIIAVGADPDDVERLAMGSVRARLGAVIASGPE